MKILIHDYGGYPFSVELARELARSGDVVEYAYNFDNTTPKGALAPKEDDPQSFSLRPLSLGRPLRKYDLIRRFVHERAYGRMLAAHIRATAPEVILSGNGSIDTVPPSMKAARAVGAGFYYWFHDIQWIGIRAALGTRLPVIGGLVALRYRRLERQCLRNSDGVINISDLFDDECDAAGVAKDARIVLPNWAPIGEMPAQPRENDWARRHDLIGKTCFLYAGTLGFKHDPSVLFDLAQHFAGRDDIRVVVVSEGPGANYLAQRHAEAPCANLILLPFQPYEDLPDVLASGDVLLAMLDEDGARFCVPSKILTNFCAARPVLASLSGANPAAKMIAGAGAGIAVPPGSPDAFRKAAADLAEDGITRGAMGSAARAYAEREFDVRRIAPRFRKFLSGA
jgi:colanic acid biosynthesis glycosyl transferase WcaI